MQFQPIQTIYSGKAKLDAFKRLEKAEMQSSSSIGQLFSLARRVFEFSIEAEKEFEAVSMMVSELLNGQLLRMADTYSIWLYATLKVSTHVHTYEVTKLGLRFKIMFKYIHFKVKQVVIV